MYRFWIVLNYTQSKIIPFYSTDRMEAPPIAGRIIKIVVVILGLVALFYLYQYLFTGAIKSSTVLVGPKTNAQTDAGKPIIIPASGMPGIYEGGEFSINMWIYIQNWNYRMGRNKHIMSIGGTNFDTLRVYLGGNKSQLRIRMHTHTPGQVINPTATPTTPTTSGSSTHDNILTPQAPTDRLDKASEQAMFTQIETDSGMLDGTPMCDLPDIDLQRWVQVVISVNGKTVDIYMDGKLSRSCVLPTFYKVDKSGYTARILDFGGFGGYISGVGMYNYAQSPDQVYHAYMAGPSPIINFGDYLKSFFEPQSTINV